MPLAVSPFQIIGADLIAMPESLQSNKYALTIICHCTGWAEVYPLKDKTCQSVWDKFANEFIPRHGVPHLMVTDRGKEFTAMEFERYLAQLGVQHNVTTPVHPCSNGRNERFHLTLKQIINQLINNSPVNWENKLGDALLAYRNAVSTTTGHTPFYLVYGRHARIPLTKMLKTTQATTFGNRLDDLSIALKSTRELTRESRHYNRIRLEKANAGQLSIGDSVVIKAEERIALTSRWDPHWQIYRIRGPVIFVRQQQTGKQKVLHREKVKLVDPTILWDECNPRPLRSQYRPRVRKSLNASGKSRTSEEVEVDVEDTPTHQSGVSGKDTHTAQSQGVSHEDTSITASQGESLEGSRDMSPMASPHVKKRKRQVPPPTRSESMPFRHRPIRERRLSRRARDLIEDDMAMDTEDNLVARHFRKREHTQETEREEAKRRRWEEISSYWYYWH